jgi:hypothetical protein
MVVMSIFFTGIIASKARLASTPPAASASNKRANLHCRRTVAGQLPSLGPATNAAEFRSNRFEFSFECDQHQ